jgi:hypothetical protein
MNQLRLTLWHDSDGTGELTAMVVSGAFSGVGKAWFGFPQLREFAASLRPFPIPEPVLIEGGYFGSEHRLAQCHLRIRIGPYRSAGALLVHVDLATDSLASPDQDLQQTATLRFVTGYQAVLEFSHALDALIGETAAEAVLLGTD